MNFDASFEALVRNGFAAALAAGVAGASSDAALGVGGRSQARARR